MPPIKPLILTAKLDAASFEYLDDLRQRYFPPERNFLSAHITLFHNLPGAEISVVRQDLLEITAAQTAIRLDFSRVRFLGRGTAVEIDAPELIALRNRLANKWQSYLTAQDQQKFHPHITVQNKTEPNTAKMTYEKLRMGWRARTGSAVGLQLWHYAGGPWELANDFVFESEKK